MEELEPRPANQVRNKCFVHDSVFSSHCRVCVQVVIVGGVLADIPRPSSLNRYSPLQPSGPASASTPSASPDNDSRGGLSRYCVTLQDAFLADVGCEFPINFCTFILKVLKMCVRCVFSSRGSLGRERNDKPLTLGPTRSGPPSVGGAGKEVVEELPQEEVHKDSHVPDTPKLQPSTASRGKLERSQSRESGEPLIWTHTNLIRSLSKTNKAPAPLFIQKK